MPFLQTKIKIILLAVVLSLFFAGTARAATTIFSPPNYSTYNVGTTVGFYWYDTSDYYYINIWNDSWGAWQYLGNQTDYTGVTRNNEGYIGAQVASWENNQWEYSNVVWVWFQNPPPPPPPPPPVPGAPTLSRAPNDPVYKGDTVIFSWDNPANTTDFYIIYRRNNVWDSTWTWTGLGQSQNVADTSNLSDLSAQVAACNVSGCGYSNQPVITLLTKTPGQMNLMPLTSGQSYSDSLGSSSDVKYSKVTNATGNDQTYATRLTADTANTTVALVDANGGLVVGDNLAFNQGHLAFKVSANSDRYLKFTGTQAGSYAFVFNRFRLFPYLEAP